MRTSSSYKQTPETSPTFEPLLENSMLITSPSTGVSSSSHSLAIKPGRTCRPSHLPRRAPLVEWIDRMNLSGHPVAPGFVQETADLLRHQRLLIDEPDFDYRCSLGVNWLQGFKRRHPNALTKLTRILDTSRQQGTTPAKLAPYFAELAELLNKHHYSPAQIHNMDKTGFAIGTTQSQRVMIIERDEGDEGVEPRKATAAGSEKGEWTTSIECINANGSKLPPLVILKGTASFNSRWMPDALRVTGWAWTTSNKGWSNDTIALEWLKHVFLPNTDRSTRQLLILDGHGSHMKADFVATCLANRIDMVVLPAHTSHQTQPLDSTIFSPLKRHLSKLVSQRNQYGDLGKLTRVEWVEMLSEARHVAMTASNIKVSTYTDLY